MTTPKHTTIDHNAEKDASYRVRREMLDTEGHDGTGWGTTLRDLRAHDGSTITAGTLCQIRTSNAGFRGIEGYARTADGRTTTASLGAFKVSEEPGL